MPRAQRRAQVFPFVPPIQNQVRAVAAGEVGQVATLDYRSHIWRIQSDYAPRYARTARVRLVRGVTFFFFFILASPCLGGPHWSCCLLAVPLALRVSYRYV